MENEIKEDASDIDQMKSQLQTKLAGLMGKTVKFTHSECIVNIEKQAGMFSIVTTYTDAKLISPGNSGSIIIIDPNGSIISYKIMPRDIGIKNGSFEISDSLYPYALSLLDHLPQ